MVLGLLAAVAAVPAIIGTTEGVKEGQRQNAREEHRGRKSNLTVTLFKRSFYSQRFDGAYIVLKDNKFWVDIGGGTNLHPFEGYFLPFPGMAEVWRERGFAKGEGMVTTISRDPPFLNWVYVDRDTHEVKYGVRADAQDHRVGPFDVTKVDRRVTFEGWEGFLAVEETPGSDLWALYFDCKDDGLRGDDQAGTQGKRMLELEIWRKEMNKDRATALDERAERLRARDESTSEETTVS